MPFLRAFIPGSPLLAVPRRPATATTPTTTSAFPITAHPTDPSPAPLDPRALHACLAPLREVFALLPPSPGAALSPHHMPALTQVDVARLVTCAVLSFRLSFPLPTVCPAWDAAAAREELRFGEFLDELCGPDDGPEARRADDAPTDVWAATVAVFRLVRRKFRARVAAWEAGRQRARVEAELGLGLGMGLAGPPSVGAGKTGCPVLDGSMEPLWRSWDEDMAALGATAGMADCPMAGLEGGGAAPPPPFPDLWASMTGGWPGQSGMGLDGP